MIRLALAKSSRRVSSSLSSSEELDEEEDESSEDLDWTMMCFLKSLLLRRFFFLLRVFLDDNLLWREGDMMSPVVHASEKFFCKRWTNCPPSVPKSCAGPEVARRRVVLLRRLLLRLRRWECDSSEEELLLPLQLEGDESSEEDNSVTTVA